MKTRAKIRYCTVRVPSVLIDGVPEPNLLKSLRYFTSLYAKKYYKLLKIDDIFHDGYGTTSVVFKYEKLQNLKSYDNTGIGNNN